MVFIQKFPRRSSYTLLTRLSLGLFSLSRCIKLVKVLAFYQTLSKPPPSFPIQSFSFLVLQQWSVFFSTYVGSAVIKTDERLRTDQINSTHRRRRYRSDIFIAIFKNDPCIVAADTGRNMGSFLKCWYVFF